MVDLHSLVIISKCSVASDADYACFVLFPLKVTHKACVVLVEGMRLMNVDAIPVYLTASVGG